MDEYCKNTGQNRKYVIRKIRKGRYIQDKTKSRKRSRKEYYDGYVKEALIKCWKIFDYPCGQRLEEILNDLYGNELRLYKNFFQPVMKLVSKERVGEKIYRKYDKPKTPYHRVMESKEASEKKKELKKIYESLNPAELKRIIDKKLDLLYEVYKNKGNKSNKNNSLKVGKDKKLTINSVTFLIAQPEPI